MRARVLLAACVLVGGITLTVAADDKPLDRAELDRRAAKVAYDAAISGTALFNSKNPEGCFRLYQGTLSALEPMLDHRPKLAAFVKEKLDEARNMRPEEGAFVLRQAIDAVQKETSESFGKVETKKTLWERMGGEKTARAVVHDFVTTASKNPKVNLTHDGKIKLDAKDLEMIEQIMLELVSSSTGGNLKYTGPPDLTPLLVGTKYTDAEFVAMLGDLAASLKKHKVPDAEALEIIEMAGRLKTLIVGK